MLMLYLQMITDERDRDKFEKLYIKYKDTMFYSAKKILKINEDAEDAVHTAFVSIIKHIEKISEVDCPETRNYVVIIVERKALDMIKARKGRIELELLDEILGVDIPLPGDGGLADAMAKLKKRHREILLLRFLYGYTTKEVAEMLDMKPESMQKAIWRARLALREILEKEGIMV